MAFLYLFRKNYFIIINPKHISITSYMCETRKILTVDNMGIELSYSLSLVPHHLACTPVINILYCTM
jgi:hypothetical protein